MSKKDIEFIRNLVDLHMDDSDLLEFNSYSLDDLDINKNDYSSMLLKIKPENRENMLVIFLLCILSNVSFE